MAEDPADLSAPPRAGGRARRVTEEDGPLILAAHADGLSQSEAARRLGLDRPSLSRWSKRHGISWGPVPLAAEIAAERTRIARQALAEQTLADALNLRKRLWDSGTEYIATRDGVETITTDLPSPRAVADLAAALERLVRIADRAASGADDPGVHAERSMLGRLHEQIRRTVTCDDETHE